MYRSHRQRECGGIGKGGGGDREVKGDSEGKDDSEIKNNKARDGKERGSNSALAIRHSQVWNLAVVITSALGRQLALSESCHPII